MMPPRDRRAFEREIRRFVRTGPGLDVHPYDHEVGVDTYELPSELHRHNAMLDRAAMTSTHGLRLDRNLRDLRLRHG